MSINLKKRLHHRSPYLLIDEIISHDPKVIVAKKTPKVIEHYLQGHFPGAPIVPGAMLQEMTTQTAGALIAEYYSPIADYDSEKTKGYALGVLRSITAAKFKRFARPDDELLVEVTLTDHMENLFHFKAKVICRDEVIMQNEFVLMNISDEHLFKNQ